MTDREVQKTFTTALGRDAVRVLRTDTGHIVIDGKWFPLMALRDQLEAMLIAAGSRNVAFDMPPAFFTGSPFGPLLLDLGVPEVSPPQTFRVEFVPIFDEEPWRAFEPMWKRLWPQFVPTQGEAP
jgi:hypothetical protein